MCGSLAQLVEQRPEEPCVPSSSLGGATKINASAAKLGHLFWPEFTQGLELEVRAKHERSELSRRNLGVMHDLAYCRTKESSNAVRNYHG